MTKNLLFPRALNSSTFFFLPLGPNHQFWFILVPRKMSCVYLLPCFSLPTTTALVQAGLHHQPPPKVCSAFTYSTAVCAAPAWPAGDCEQQWMRWELFLDLEPGIFSPPPAGQEHTASASIHMQVCACPAPAGDP